MWVLYYLVCCKWAILQYFVEQVVIFIKIPKANNKNLAF